MARLVRAIHAFRRLGAHTAHPACAPAYGANYDAAFVIDPDGYRIEAYFGDEP